MAALRAASLLALAAPGLASASCPADEDCLHCYDNNPWRCTQCAAGYTKNTAGEGLCLPNNCHWTQEDEDDFGRKLFAGTIVGGVVAAIMVIVASLPVCCGVMKDSPNLKCIGAIVGVIAGFCILIPAITGAVSGSQAVDDFCDSCSGGCSESEREEAKDAVSALGVIFAYLPAMGFIVVILAIVALSLSCCMCCPCCGPLQAAQQAKAQGGSSPQAQGAPAAVVGVPVNNNVGC